MPMDLDATLNRAKQYVDEKVQPGSFGRVQDNYKGEFDGLLTHQQDMMKGYDSNAMQAARSQAQASFAGGANAFGRKMGAGGAGAFQPFAQTAKQQYASGITVDNAAAKDRGIKGYGDTLARTQAQELAIGAKNREAQESEQGLRAALPFEIAQGINSTRTSMLANLDAKYAVDIAQRYKDILSKYDKMWQDIDAAKAETP